MVGTISLDKPEPCVDISSDSGFFLHDAREGLCWVNCFFIHLVHHIALNCILCCLLPISIEQSSHFEASQHPNPSKNQICLFSEVHFKTLTVLTTLPHKLLCTVYLLSLCKLCCDVIKYPNDI